MDRSNPSPPLMSPLGSPEIRISRPEYASIPQRTSDDETYDSRTDRRSRFEEAIEPGLGIQMRPFASPTSPGKSYSQQSTPKAGMFSSFSPTALRPLYQRTPDTLYSFGSGISRARTDPMTERLIAHRATQSAKWKVHWRTPSTMVFAFVAGILLALAQHFWYRFLHHRPTYDEDQKFRWVLYGRVLAYLSKVAFGGCVVLVFRQRIWRTFRKRALSVLSIDQLFGATDDPSLFANWEIVSNAPMAVAIATVFWLIPLATIIFSPGALTFGDYLDTNAINRSVPHINFMQETTKDWRHPIPYNAIDDELLPKGGNKRSLMYYNTTDKSQDPTTPNWFDYYDQPSAELRRVALLFGYNLMNHSTHRLGARQYVCGKPQAGGPYNCTFTQSFIAPAYKCDLAADGIGDNSRLAELGAPFNTSSLLPEGRNIYQAEVKLGDYKQPQMENFQKGPGGLPVGEAPADLGVFKAEPVLWIGYSINSTERLPSDSPFSKNWTHRYDPRIIRCVMNEAKYTVRWNFTGSFFMEMTTLDFLGPVLDTTFTRNENGTLNYAADPVPAENFIRPLPDVGLYKKIAAYHAMGEVLRGFLGGHVELEPPLPGPSYAVVSSDVTKTRLVDVESLPKKDFGKVLEGFFADLVLSLYSAPEMLVVEDQDVELTRTQWQSSFVYVPKRLWMCYAPVIFVTLIILLFGVFTIWEDGTTFSTGFSRILVTTRNTTLDDISRGACLGNDPFPMELMHTRLKFGVLSEGSENESMGTEGFQHCAFGVASEVAPIRRGVPYAGLRRRIQGLKVIEEEAKT
ncbi:hypothetical protein BU25DRAFT_410341 [Macroventuria anomochaeta]|uniref:Uncharacterized protein n=1 Tax=Macroventuria anomochaeta TaxID=301207 RepID=A0ACB6S264_9PLEO|nr:uncharacterized protein BU25DRAFT_410341 [Macroventuria anomochaeta]KAF2628246.1 hypothetical protein BU25DRAFT_410341 [Macroventuria anomochaeta]